MDMKRGAVSPAPNPGGLLERTFRLAEHGTTVRTELLAGLTTFLTMAYIVFVNPSILADAGMPRGAVFVATCLVAALGSAIMGLYANYPIALAPGMGLNAYFTYVVVQGLGFSWPAALGAVFISGLCFLIVTLTGLRAIIVDGIPPSMRIAITAGIGLFLAIIALRNAGVVAASPATFVTLGDLHKPAVVLAVIGFLMVAVLSARKVRAALLSSILAVTVLSFAVAGNSFQGLVSLPPSIAPTLFALDIPGALSGGLLNVILVLFLVELFDATGTLMGVANRAGLLTEGRMRRLDRALMADSVSVFAGSLLGTSSTTAYLESASGVEEGGRTGLTAVTVAALFLACLFFAPLAAAVPPYATAPALFYVACLMLRDLADLDWDDRTEVIPACVTALLMPFTYSIATGVSCGFITYAALKLLTGRAREVKPVVWVIAAIFLFKFVFVGGAH
ncbi:NCS2 family permease [Methylobacterium sp. 2A]|jgi:AGZA family xanthine/uracil permease-like MFS transporter|uniref:NCS2 family permease n=1 Tax=Methylobacterium sp. 2A TaxID=2603816 RepID=UPI0013549E05|nr:NCS2 family permease [Methylobacterium sp. 2A]MWV24146.1 NCS2 family permease [Methylobacterium sp. 2A]